MTINSRSKGARGEREVIELLRKYWPEARRNLDQYTDHKQDALDAIAGVHWQIKRVGSRLDIWKALAQAEGEAYRFDLPVLAFRRDHGHWYGALPLDELIALLRLREL